MTQLDYRPTVEDSVKRWSSERAKVNIFGRRALAVIGASRFQLGIDLKALGQITGLEPIQLAIDGTSFVPILQGLANDPSFTGTVIIDYYNSSVMNFSSGGTSVKYQAYYESEAKRGRIVNGEQVESELTDWVRSHMRVYADGASPYQSLVTRILPRKKEDRYLVTLATRERLADYRKVKMPEFYYYRVLRELGLERQISPFSSNIKELLEEKVAHLEPERSDGFPNQVKLLAAMVSKIEQRGGRVAFVAMPTSGLMKTYEERRYPQDRFWGQFKKYVGAMTLKSADSGELREFNCPDGSHLDYRDRTRFTTLLAEQLVRNGLLNSNVSARGRSL